MVSLGSLRSHLQRGSNCASVIQYNKYWGSLYQKGQTAHQCNIEGVALLHGWPSFFFFFSVCVFFNHIFVYAWAEIIQQPFSAPTLSTWSCTWHTSIIMLQPAWKIWYSTIYNYAMSLQVPYIYISIYPRASLNRVLLSCLLWDVCWHALFFQEPAWNIFIFLLHVWYWLLYKLYTSFIQEPVWRIWFDYVVYLWVSFCRYLTQAGGMVKIFC